MKKITLFIFSIVCMLSTVNAQDITVFNFDGVTPTFTGSDPVVKIANPTTDGINASVNVGQLTHTGQYNDASTTVDIDPRVYNSIEMMVYSPYSTTGKVTIACFDASGNQLDWYESSAIATSGVWTKVTRNISFTKNIAKVMVGFNRNDAPSTTANDNIVYYDNLVFKKTTSSFLTIYNESFYASWSQYGDWSGVPSTKAGSWFGGVNLQTTGDATMNLAQWWGDHGHVLKIYPTDAEVIIPNIDVSGFDNLKLSADMTWPWSKTEQDAGYYSASDADKKPIIDVKIGAGDWVSVPTSVIGDWATSVILLKDGSGNPISNVSTISIRLSHTSLYTVVYDNVKILGKSIQTGLFNPGYETFSVYPNPATNYILTQNAQKVSILDLNGRIVKEAYNTEKVDISSLAKGSYIVKAQIENVTKIGKLIKE